MKDNKGKQSNSLLDVQDTNLKRYRVNVNALKVDWLFKREGWDFLNALYNEGNDELFRSKTVVVITEYLYNNIRPVILQWQLSVYLIQMVLFFMQIFKKFLFSAEFDC